MPSALRVPRTIVSLLITLVLAMTALMATAGVTSAQSPTYPLRIIDPPASVFVGQEFAVEVAVTDGERIVTNPCPTPVEVTLRVTGPSDAWSQIAEEDQGVATFDVTVDSSGTWHLAASVALPPCSATFPRHEVDITAVSAIPPGQPVAPCPSVGTCEQTWNGGNTAATLIAKSGSFTVARFLPNSELSCARGHLEPNSVLEFDHDGYVKKTVIFALNRSLIKKPLSRYRICWSSDIKFLPRGGRKPVNTGFLRNCRPGVHAPCVLFRTWIKGGALIGVLAPPGDPKGYAR